MKTFIAAVALALAAWYIGKALGLPAWRHFASGDRTDIAALVFIGVLLLGGDR